MTEYVAPASLKAARAVGGDDWFVERMKVVCEIEDKSYSERLGYMVAYSLEEFIDVDEHMTVSTARVSDNKLKSAITTQYGKLEATV